MRCAEMLLCSAGLERIKELSSSCEGLRNLDRVSNLHQRAITASKDLQVIEVLTHCKELNVFLESEDYMDIPRSSILLYAG